MSHKTLQPEPLFSARRRRTTFNEQLSLSVPRNQHGPSRVRGSHLPVPTRLLSKPTPKLQVCTKLRSTVRTTTKSSLELVELVSSKSSKPVIQHSLSEATISPLHEHHSPIAGAILKSICETRPIRPVSPLVNCSSTTRSTSSVSSANSSYTLDSDFSSFQDPLEDIHLSKMADTINESPPVASSPGPILPHTALIHYVPFDLPYYWSPFHKHFLVHHPDECRTCKRVTAHVTRKQFRRTVEDIDAEDEANNRLYEGRTEDGTLKKVEAEGYKRYSRSSLVKDSEGETVSSHCVVCGRGEFVS